MDTSKIVIFIVFLAVCVLPIIYISRKGKKKEKQTESSFQKMVSMNAVNVKTIDRWHNTIIGIDEKNAMLFFVRNGNEEEISKAIELKDINKCIVNNIAKAGNSSSQIMELILTGDKGETTLEFYNSEVDGFTLTGQLQIIGKWHKIISGIIKKNK